MAKELTMQFSYVRRRSMLALRDDKARVREAGPTESHLSRLGMADGYAQGTGRTASVHPATGTGNAMGALTNIDYAQLFDLNSV